MNITQIRRYIHSIAELSNREYKTQEFIINFESICIKGIIPTV